MAMVSSSGVREPFVRFNIAEVALSKADFLRTTDRCSMFYLVLTHLNLYLLQMTIFGNLAFSTGVVFEINVVDTVAS